MWVDLWGQSFADEQVRIESLRKGIVDYESLWRKTLAAPVLANSRRQFSKASRESGRLVAPRSSCG